jgi:hypothetical protein
MSQQKLIEIMVQSVLTVLDPNCHADFAAMDQEEKVAWVGRQLRACGFHTVPATGSEWLRLADEHEYAQLSNSAIVLLARMGHETDGVFVSTADHANGPIYELLLSGLAERIKKTQRGKWYRITDLGYQWLMRINDE